MDEKLLLQIISQQVYLMKRLLDLERKVNKAGRMMAEDQTYYEDLVKGASEIRITITTGNRNP